MTNKTLVPYITFSLLIAGAYYAFGIIIKPLILPPTFAAPIWPSAGIAVAVLILWGYKYIPAILLGEILINFNFYKFDEFIDQPSLIFTYVLMLVATVVRSAVGAYLVKSHLGKSNNFLTMQSVLKLFLFAGIIPTFLSTSISTFALASSGLLRENSIVLNFWTWWFGDSMGVFILLPIMFLVFKKPRNVWKPRLLKTTVPVIITFSLLIVVALSLNQLERKRLIEKLLNKVELVADDVVNLISQNRPILNEVPQQQIVDDINKIFSEKMDLIAENLQLNDIHFIVYTKTDVADIKIYESSNKSLQPYKWKAQKRLKFANHEWEVVGIATSQYIIHYSSWLLWWMLSIGFIFLASMTAALLILTGNNIIINDKVIKRTNEINTLNSILQESTNKYKQLVEIQPVIFWKHILGENMLEFVSNEAFSMLGYTQKELMSLDIIWNKILYPEDKNRFIKEYYEGIKSNKRFILKYRGVTKAGQVMFFKDYISTKKINDKIEIIGLKIDITNEQERELKIAQLAYYDGLTQLPNRESFKIQLQMALNKSKKDGTYGGILYLNLNRFKVLNDSMGRFFGDKLLVQISKRIKTILRKTDFISRFGSDEFVILGINQKREFNDAQNNLILIAEKIQLANKQAYDIDGHHFFTSFSIGITIFSSQQTSVEEIIQQANIAMFVAKAHDKNEIICFEKSMQDDANERLKIEKELKIALIRQEFEMYYQPIFNKQKELIKLEALIRWNHPDGGLLLPFAFIYIAEESGFITELSEWIIDNVFEQVCHWHRENQTKIPVSINISLFQFANTKLIQTLQDATTKYKIDTSKITLELTESIGINNFPDALKKLTKLKNMGFKLAIDDFGTGYSSLNYLLKMPIDILKLDQSFVAKIGIDDNSEKLIKTIKIMSNQLNLDIIVEGVETEKQFEFLIALGFEEFQGFLVSRAVPASQLNIINFKNKTRSIYNV